MNLRLRTRTSNRSKSHSFEFTGFFSKVRPPFFRALFLLTHSPKFSFVTSIAKLLFPGEPFLIFTQKIRFGLWHPFGKLHQLSVFEDLSPFNAQNLFTFFQGVILPSESENLMHSFTSPQISKFILTNFQTVLSFWTWKLEVAGLWKSIFSMFPFQIYFRSPYHFVWLTISSFQFFPWSTWLRSMCASLLSTAFVLDFGGS